MTITVPTIMFVLNRHLSVAEWLARLTALWGPRFESHRGTAVFIATAAAIYSLGHGLRTFTAVPRSTQPSTLREYQLMG